MVTSSYPKHRGDVTAPFIDSIARAVAARGHRVDVLLPHHPDLRQPDADGVRFVPYRYAPHAALNLWGYAQSLESDVRIRRRAWMVAPFVAFALRRALKRLLAATRYDVVHAHWVVPNAAMVADVVKRSGVPLVISLHGSDVFVAESLGPAGHLARRAFAASGAVTACSGDLRARAIALGATSERTRTVPYGVDVSAFAPGADVAAVRARFGVPDGAALIVAVGRLVEKKGFRYLLDAVSFLAGAVLVVVGDGDLRASLEQQAQARGVPVRFTGNLERTLVAEALGAADVVAVPSVVDDAGNVDGLPNVLLEAMAAGRAVVASRVAGIPDVIEDGVNGLLVPPADPPALAAALGRLCADATLREQLGAAARRTAMDTLTWDAVAHAFEECYVQASALDAR
jgi:glycosyltransferase involved in cell wall biosynthesis